KLRAFRVYPVISFPVLRFGNANDGSPYRAVAVERLFIDIIEEGAERIEVFLRGWIEFVIVADGTSNGQAQKRSAIGLGAIAGYLEAQLFGNCAALVAAFAHANIPAGNKGIEILRWEEIAGDLFHCKLVKGLVVIESADHVIPIRPDMAAIVVVQAVGV